LNSTLFLFLSQPSFLSHTHWHIELFKHTSVTFQSLCKRNILFLHLCYSQNWTYEHNHSLNFKWAHNITKQKRIVKRLFVLLNVHSQLSFHLIAVISFEKKYSLCNLLNSSENNEKINKEYKVTDQNMSTIPKIFKVKSEQRYIKSDFFF